MIEFALEIFKRNVASFPDAYHIYDRLGEAYLIAGQNEQALEMYKKSLILNPEIKHVLQMIKKFNRKHGLIYSSHRFVFFCKHTFKFFFFCADSEEISIEPRRK